MSNQRKNGQTFVGCHLEDDLLLRMDQAREFKDRSIFIREAIGEKLQRMGYEIQKDWVYKNRVKNLVQGTQVFAPGASNSGTVIMGSQFNESQKKTHSDQNDPNSIQFQPSKGKSPKSKKSG